MARGYDYADSAAALAMAAALKRAGERGLSLRQIAKLLDYKQAVVLSHMALGRVPIPLDRAEDIAGVLDLDKAQFLRMVAEQRHPDVTWGLLATTGVVFDDAAKLAGELEAIAGVPISKLSAEHRAVLREVAGSAHPRRRWLSEHEVPVVAALRDYRPEIRESGLEDRDMQNLQALLALPRADP